MFPGKEGHSTEEAEELFDRASKLETIKSGGK